MAGAGGGEKTEPQVQPGEPKAHDIFTLAICPVQIHRRQTNRLIPLPQLLPQIHVTCLIYRMLWEKACFLLVFFCCSWTIGEEGHNDAHGMAGVSSKERQRDTVQVFIVI